MTRRVRQQRKRPVWILAAAVSLGLGALAPSWTAAQGQGRQGAEGVAQKTLRAAAPIDLTGWWVANGSEDWRYRWVVPVKGELSGVPINAKGREVADQWDPAADEAAGLQCKAYGMAGLMRVPGRIHITWQDDNTLKIDTDAGQQTRLLKFGATPPPADEKSWQGFSSASWQIPRDPQPGGGGDGDGAARSGGGQQPQSVRHAGQLQILTTHLRAGYLRKNGVPYSDTTTVTEYYTRAAGPDGSEWLIITTIVIDPVYLNEPFITSTNFKKEPDGSKWSPTSCNTREPR